MITLLAQAENPTGRAVVMIGIAIALLIVLGFAVTHLRRVFLQPEPPSGGLDMETIQRRHRAGEISEAEFKALRRAILGLPAEGTGPAAERPETPTADEPEDRP